MLLMREQSTGKKPSEPPPKPKPNSRSSGRRVGSIDATPNRKVQQKHRKGVEEEEDDSDLEILSISSGDDDHGSSKKESKGASKRRAPKGGKDDDAHWQGGEPDCWKRVDEDELRRHVRDMREARAIPATQIKAEEEKMALAKKALQSLQSFPRGMECIDPLRLGIVDNRTLRMISEHSSSSPTVGDLDPKTREGLNYFSEKFDSKLFISRIHQDTGAADLEGGAVSLKTDLKGRMQQKKQLVKENFDCFVSCKTTIDD
uniref:Exocyst complex component SEC5 n=1 Tax=Solanum lycopersicum TaxID=4081 RepID=A0A3Q7JB46_SOLLC